MTLLDEFARRTAEHPDRTALIEPSGASISFAELERRAQALANAWARQGIEPGDRVLVAVWPGIALYASLAALWRLGAVAVLPEAAMGLAGLRHAAAAAAPKALLADTGLRLIAAIFPETRAIPLGLSPRAEGGPGRASWREPRPDDPALMSFTSGSTGKPKAMLRNHGLLLAQHHALAPLIAPRHGPQIDLVAFPAFVLTCLGQGVTAVLPGWNMRRHDLVSAATIARAIARHGVTRLLVPPVITARLAKDGLPPDAAATLRQVLTGGGPIYPDTALAFLKSHPGLGLTMVYGSPEAEPISHIAAETLSDDDWRDAAQGGGLPVGAPVEEATVAIVDDEILVAGPHVNPAYVDPSHRAGAKVWRDGRLFHRTGDCGRLDARGRLWLLGRRGAARPGLFPFAIETAARLQPVVEGAALVSGNAQTVLFVQGTRARLEPGFRTRLEALNVILRPIDAIPLDRRHRSKPDYAALRRRL